MFPVIITTNHPRKFILVNTLEELQANTPFILLKVSATENELIMIRLGYQYGEFDFSRK